MKSYPKTFNKGQNRTQNNYFYQKLHSALDIRKEKQAKNIVIPVTVTLVAHLFVKKAQINSKRVIMGSSSMEWKLDIFGESQVLDLHHAQQLVSIQKFILSWIGFTQQ